MRRIKTHTVKFVESVKDIIKLFCEIINLKLISVFRVSGMSYERIVQHCVLHLDST